MATNLTDAQQAAGAVMAAAGFRPGASPGLNPQQQVILDAFSTETYVANRIDVQHEPIWDTIGYSNGAQAAAGFYNATGYPVGFSGNYPRAFDGLARLLSLDMRVIDPAWIGMKLRKLLNYAEPLGHFMAFVPGLPHGERRQQTWPSTVAYMARLIIHRYAMLGVLDEEGFPLRDMGVLEAPGEHKETSAMAGKTCTECGNPTVIQKDGCEFCTACGFVGQCG